MRKVFIYILFDPRKPELVRYVGQTLTPHSRHIQGIGRQTLYNKLNSYKDGFV